MTTPAAASFPPDGSTPSGRRPARWLARGLFALVLVGLPLAGIAALGGLWWHSTRVEASWTATRDQRSFDPLARLDTRRHLNLTAIAPRGLLALSVLVAEDWAPPASPAEEQQIRSERGLVTAAKWSGWASRFNHADPPQPSLSCIQRPEGPAEFGLDPADAARRGLFLPGDPDRPLDLPRDDGGLRPLTSWSWRLDGDDPAAPAGDRRVRLFVLAPIWLWMLPLLGPIVWWAWCPAGSVVPRLTLGRLGLAVAGLALILALVCRPPAADRAVLALNDLDASWYYGPGPAGPGRPRLVGLALPYLDNAWGAAPTAAEVEAAHAALLGLPDLRYLSLAAQLGPPDLATALLPERWPGLEALILHGSQADDSTAARIGAGYPGLRRLDLAGTRVTDAGLAHLRSLDELTSLDLDALPLTDAGLAHLRGLPNLRRIDFEGQGWARDDTAPAAFSDAALRALVDSLPRFEELVRPDGSVLNRHPHHPGPPTGFP